MGGWLSVLPSRATSKHHQPWVSSISHLYRNTFLLHQDHPLPFSTGQTLLSHQAFHIVDLFPTFPFPPRHSSPPPRQLPSTTTLTNTPKNPPSLRPSRPTPFLLQLTATIVRPSAVTAGMTPLRSATAWSLPLFSVPSSHAPLARCRFCRICCKDLRRAGRRCVLVGHSRCGGHGQVGCTVVVSQIPRRRIARRAIEHHVVFKSANASRGGHPHGRGSAYAALL
jgi:hypothetical protein